MKSKKTKNPTTKAEIIRNLINLAGRMDSTAAMLAEHSAEETWKKHSYEMRKAAIIARQWAFRLGEKDAP